jgi:hypothetical protein
VVASLGRCWAPLGLSVHALGVLGEPLTHLCLQECKSIASELILVRCFERLHRVALGGCHLLGGLVACGSVKACKKIVRGFGEAFVRGIVLTSWGSQRATLVEYVIELPHLMVGSCCAFWEARCVISISRRTTKCWSTQRGRSLVATKWTLGENHRVNLVYSSWWFEFTLHKLIFTFIYTCVYVVALVTSLLV